MQKFIALLALSLCLGSTAYTSVQKDEATYPLRSLSPESKESLKKLILMNGRLEPSCEDHDPDACLGSNIKRSPSDSLKTDASDTLTISTASVEKPATTANTESVEPTNLAPAASATPDIVSDTERKELVRSLSADCKANNAAACTRLAKISAEMKKHRTSVQLYKRACDLGDARICHELGNRLAKAGKQDLAELYMAKACTQGDKSACKQTN